jgi:hypothetical protein
MLSLAALPANSRISALKYSITAANKTGAPATTTFLKILCIRPTENCNSVLDDFDLELCLLFHALRLLVLIGFSDLIKDQKGSDWMMARRVGSTRRL